MRIYIIGFMGSGKSTIGRTLARELHYDFIDLDRYVEQCVGRTIPEIFATEGEQAFRDYESRYLRQCAALSPNLVVSTGGGTPCVGDNMDFMLDDGLTLYLKHDAGQLSERLRKSHTVRPLIAGKDADGIGRFVEAKLGEREATYLRSSIVVANPSRDARRIVELVEMHKQHIKTF